MMLIQEVGMAMLLEWQERWNTDIPDIDEQHIAMANQLNRISEMVDMLDDKQEHNDQLSESLSELLEMTRVHFASEELLMSEHDYPDYSDHQKEHTVLMAELAQLIREVRRDQSVLDRKTLQELKQWFVIHLVGADKEFAKHYDSVK